MRKYLGILLAGLLVMMLAGCGSDDTQQDTTQEPTTEETTVEEVPQVIPEPELQATPEPVQIPLMDPSEITLESSVNRTLGVSYQFPSEWETVYGKHTLCYVEPTTAGIEPARMAISAKAVSSKPSDAEMEAQFALLMEKVGLQYENLVVSEIKYGVSLLGEKGYRQSYTAMVNGQEVTGYAVMAYTHGNIYLLHMSGATERYEALADVWYGIRMAVLPL